MDKKELEYKGRKFLYSIEEHDCGDYGAFVCYVTNFYDPNPIIKQKKKWFLFGPLVEYKEYINLFEIDLNIESPHVTKKEIRELLDKQIDLLNRKEEIKKGEFV